MSNVDQPGMVMVPISIGARKNHKKAIKQNNKPTHFSSLQMAPSSSYSSDNTVLGMDCMSWIVTYIRYNKTKAATKIIRLKETAKTSQAAKINSGASGNVIE